MSSANTHTSKPASLLSIVICLTIITIAAQMIFFIIHYKVSDLVDSLVQSSLKFEIFHSSILLPLLNFLLIHLIGYSLFILWIWFITLSISEFCHLSPRNAFWLCLCLWFISCGALLSLNNNYYPNSFFATLIPTHRYALLSFTSLLFIATMIAYTHFFLHKRHIFVGSTFLILGCVFAGASWHDAFQSQKKSAISQFSQPNIILIGLDSLRPDYTGYLGHRPIKTPHIDAFLQTGTTFTEAYTPLARTFPAWISILTAEYPKHNHARTNLGDPSLIHADETLATRLKAVGYETIYGTDEKRFSNITERYGFDRIIGPRMGVNDFLLGGLTDFPLTNLMINTSLGRILFPYNYGNRAAAITYEPDTFLQLVKLGLTNRPNKPLFLAIHLCISHWPFTWARDQSYPNLTMPEKYQSSVEAVDQQLGQLMQILKENGLLEHSLVVLLSDHGTTLGLPHDRLISEKNYQGDPAKLKWIPTYKLSTAPDISLDLKKDYSINTSYGQGTDILSLKQYHVLLAFKGFGIKIVSHLVNDRASLLDITPTILHFLHLPPLKAVDGISLNNFLFNLEKNKRADLSRVLFLETGYSITEIETKNIVSEQVVKHSIGIYQINPLTGQLFINPVAEKSVNRNKQRAILIGNWLLARYPEKLCSKLAPSGATLNLKSYTLPSFFVIANVKSGIWNIGLDSALAKEAPMKELVKEFNGFYGDEV